MANDLFIIAISRIVRIVRRDNGGQVGQRPSLIHALESPQISDRCNWVGKRYFPLAYEG